MTSKPTGAAVAARAVGSVGEGITYEKMDCQAWVEYVIAQCDGELAASGSNDMARHHVIWLGTVAQARAHGYLVPGAAMFIREDSGMEPGKYKADGLGDYSHVGLYAGEKALRDMDKSGKLRECCIVHSSASMGRVAGSAMGNGWTHVGLLKCLEHGFAVGNSGGAIDTGISEDEDAAHPSVKADGNAYARVIAVNGLSVKLRNSPSRREPVYQTVPNGARVRMISVGTGWHKVSYNGYKGYVMSEFLVLED